VQWSSIV